MIWKRAFKWITIQVIVPTFKQSRYVMIYLWSSSIWHYITFLHVQVVWYIFMFTFIQNFYSSIFWKKCISLWSFLLTSLCIASTWSPPFFFTPIDFLKNCISSWPNPYHCNRLGSPQTTVLTIPPRQHQAQAIIPWWLNNKSQQRTSPKMHCPLVTVVPKCLMKATNPVRAMSTMLEPLQME